MRYSRSDLQALTGGTLPDLLPQRTRLLFVGINPGLWTAATQTHFSHPGNRFYPALLEAGIIDRPIDRVAGMSDDDRAHLVRRGIGITNVVSRATAKASELGNDELRAGGERLRAFVREHRPAVVAIAGITAYRTAFSRPKAVGGEQPEALEGARLFVVPNPSGLNAHETTSSLAVTYREAAVAAGVVS